MGKIAEGGFDPCQAACGKWVNPEQVIPTGRYPFGKHESLIATALKRQKVQPVRLPLQKTAQADIKALLISCYSSTDRRMNDKRDVFTFADVFDGFETQHR